MRCSVQKFLSNVSIEGTSEQKVLFIFCRIYTKYTIYTIGGGVEREMDGWMVYCLISGLTITILWVNDMYT